MSGWRIQFASETFQTQTEIRLHKNNNNTGSRIEPSIEAKSIHSSWAEQIEQYVNIVLYRKLWCIQRFNKSRCESLVHPVEFSPCNGCESCEGFPPINWTINHSYIHKMYSIFQFEVEKFKHITRIELGLEFFNFVTNLYY